jgi:chromosome partitioning protein
MVAITLGLVNAKGGVSKTLSTLNLAVELSRRAGRVLMVDFDPQSSLTQTLGIRAEEHNMAEVLGVSTKGSLEIVPTIVSIADNLDLAPSDILLSRTEMTLIVRPAHEQQLARALEPVRERYAYIVIDAPPSMGMLTINAVYAADYVIVPTQLDVLALRGIGLFLETLTDIREDYGRAADLLGVLATMVDLRTRHAQDVLAALRERPDLRMFTTTIPRTIRFSEAAMEGKALVDYEPGSLGALAYAQLAEEVIHRVA